MKISEKLKGVIPCIGPFIYEIECLNFSSLVLLYYYYCYYTCKRYRIKDQQHRTIQIRALCEHIATINTRWDMCYSPIQSDWMVRGTNESSTIKTTAANIKSQWTIYRYTLFSNTCTFQFTRKYCSAFRGLDGRCHFQIIFWSPSKEELCMKI